MLAHHLAGSERAYRGVVVLVLLFVALAICLQTFHSHAASTSASHCTLCEVGQGPVSVPIGPAVMINCIILIVDVLNSPVTLQAPEGSNLSVRPPPLLL